MTLGLYGPVLEVLYNFAVSVSQLTSGLELFLFSLTWKVLLWILNSFSTRAEKLSSWQAPINQLADPNIGLWILNKL